MDWRPPVLVIVGILMIIIPLYEYFRLTSSIAESGLLMAIGFPGLPVLVGIILIVVGIDMYRQNKCRESGVENEFIEA